VLPGPEAVLADVITHPEMLAVARLLIVGQHPPGTQSGEIAARLGFPYPAAPARSTLSGTTCHGDPRRSAPGRRSKHPAEGTITGNARPRARGASMGTISSTCQLN
jgi:hypothetical protein